MKRLVIVESPYASRDGSAAVERNVEYARACIRDSLDRGECPIASHLLYTQPGVLDDAIPEEREQGIFAGLEWVRAADAMILYTDRGTSPGMLRAEACAKVSGLVVEYRTLPGSGHPRDSGVDPT